MSDRILTADAIFSAADADLREFVPCPEWGTYPEEVIHPETGAKSTVQKPKGVFVRAMTMTERGKIRRLATIEKADPKSPTGWRDVLDAEKMECLTVVTCATDEAGKLLFKPTDAEALMSKVGGPVGRIAKKAMALAGLFLKEEDEGN